MTCKECGFPVIYAKGYCRNCYARNRRNGSPAYKRKRGEPTEKQIAMLEIYDKTKSAKETAEAVNCNRSYVYAILHQYKTPITNAERIRSMTDEELADWFSSIAEEAVKSGGKIKSSCWLDWLKQEAKT